MNRLFVIAGALLGLAAGAAAQPTVYFHGTIYTADSAHPKAAAIAVRDSRIVAVGTLDEARTAAGEGAAEVDLMGGTVLPGLIDAHGHMAGLGSFGIGVLDFSRATSFDDVVHATADTAKAKPAGSWVLGGRWDHESWPGKALPTESSLSESTPDNPVWLRRVDGHAGIANRKAMEAAGITKDTQSPPGGEIIRNAAGEPTGVFVDNATSLIEKVIPAGARGEPEELLLKAQEMCLAAGLTEVHDAGVSPAEIALYQRLEREGKLKLRCYLMVSGPYAMKWFDQHAPIIGDRVTVRAAKLYMDGAMGSRGAWLLAPYSDRPTGQDGKPYCGLSVSDPAMIEAVATHALAKGYQVCTHAIGDRANREVINAYVRAIQSARPAGVASAPMPDHRFRIEHAQLLAPEEVTRFHDWGIIASMQPTHCTSDMRWVEARVGPERAKGAYAWASLLSSGALVAGGSDFPVESHNPFLGFYAAITRQNAQGEPKDGWLPRECVMRGDALYMFTRSAAAAAFQEKDKGSLEVGKWADFTVIDRDVMTCDPKEILGTKVLRTVIGGETVYQSP